MKRIALILLLCAAALALNACARGDTAGVKGDVDIDLAALSGTVVYSQVYAMLEDPQAYVGQTVRMKGNFDYFKDNSTGNEYFAAVIADATACCAEGIEFVRSGEHAYPQDYPRLNALVTVTGTFDTYEQDGRTYVHLTDASMAW